MNAAELSFDLPGDAHVLFTARAHGNLSSVGGDGAEHGLESRERLRTQVGVGRLQRGYQVHGTSVQRVREGAQASEDVEADGQATDLRGLGVLVLTADCLPVALSTGDAVAIVHAGWRGLAGGVLEEGVRALRELDGEGDLVAVIGPGAGPCCYEVGEEVHAAFGGAHRTGASPACDPSGQNPPGRRIDLKAIARDRLLAVGASEVRDVAACTICDERFFSHRREGVRAGRQGAVAWLS